jgi:PAS domain S-box-containing protein
MPSLMNKNKNSELLINPLEKFPGMIYQLRFYVDGRASISYVSDKVVDIFGLSPQNLKADASTLLEMIVDEDKSCFFDSLKESACNLELWEIEFRIKMASGEEKWIAAKGMPERQMDSSTLWMGDMMDVTARNLKKHLNYHSMIASISSGFVNASNTTLKSTIHDSIKRCAMFFNTDRCYMHLFSAEKSGNDCIYEHCASGIKQRSFLKQDYNILNWWFDQVKELIISDVSSDVNISEDLRNWLHSQQVRSHLAFPLSSNGRILGFLGLDMVDVQVSWSNQQINQLRVISEIISNAIAKNNAQTELKKSEIRYRLLAENARDLIYRIQIAPIKLFEYVSPSATILTGYTPEEHYNDFDLGLKIIHPDDHQMFHDMTSGQGMFEKPLLLRWIKKDGTIFWCEQSNVPIYNEHGELVAIEGIARDVTEQKNAEEELKIVNAELQDKKYALEMFNKSLEQRIAIEVGKNRHLDHLMALQARQAALGEMIGNIAHQWRQPLNAVSLAIYDLAEAFEHDEIDEQYISNTMNEVNRIVQQMSRTIDDFRSYFKPQKEKKLFKVSDVISSALKFMSADFESHNITVYQQLDTNAVAFGYSYELTQVLINILKNARDAILENKPGDKCIDVFLFEEDSRCIIEITNMGNIISENDMARIFDPYFTTRKNDDNIGLGLYIAKTLIEKNMNGKLYCHNLENGVKFVVALRSDENRV